MSKKEIIKEIRELTGCSEEKAEDIFKKGVESEDIKLSLDWEWLINRAVIGAVVLTGIWALWKHIG